MRKIEAAARTGAQEMDETSTPDVDQDRRRRRAIMDELVNQVCGPAPTWDGVGRMDEKMRAKKRRAAIRRLTSHAMRAARDGKDHLRLRLLASMVTLAARDRAASKAPGVMQ